MDTRVFEPYYHYFIKHASQLLTKFVDYPDETAQDLVHDIFLYLQEKEVDVKYPKSYFRRIIHFQIFDNTSRFHYKYIKHSQKAIKYHELKSEDWNIEQLLTDYHNEVLLSEAVHKLDPFEIGLISAVYTSGKTMKEIAKESGIPYGVLLYKMTQIKEDIKDEVERIR